jgi:hypothetical protein
VGLRSLERRLLPRIRDQIVEGIVEGYLSDSESAGRLLSPIKYLKEPILSHGFAPSGLQDAIRYLYRLQPPIRKTRYVIDPAKGIEEVEAPVRPDDSKKRVEFPDSDSLVEMILRPPARKPSQSERRLGRLFSKSMVV